VSFVTFFSTDSDFGGHNNVSKTRLKNKRQEDVCGVMLHGSFNPTATFEVLVLCSGLRST